MAPNPQPLFVRSSLDQFLHQRRDAMKAEINTLGPDLLRHSATDLRAQFEAKYRIAPLLLGSPPIVVEQGKTQINLTGTSRGARYLNPSRAGATRVVFAIPFRGDPRLFHLQPNTFTSMPPRGIVAESELHLVIHSLTHDAADIRSQLDRLLKDLHEDVAWSVQDVQSFNATIGDLAVRLIDLRQKEIAQAENTIKSLGLPIRKPATVQQIAAPKPSDPQPSTITPQPLPAPSTISIQNPASEIQYPASGIRPPATSTRLPASETQNPVSSHKHPVSALEHYFRILDTIKGMARSIERLPKTFADADEETLRNHLLVPLNGLYPGAATGETNCGDGRPDILVRDHDRTLFIGECKIWHGKPTINDGIRQLLGYCNWQVTQTGLILFVRNVKISFVLHLVRDIVPRHPQFKRAVPERSSDVALCYAFEQTDDPDREMLLTILPLHIPAKPQKLEAPAPDPIPPKSLKSPKRRKSR